jgi:hypothetical protein
VTDDDDGPLLFADDELEFEDDPNEDPNPKGPERFLFVGGEEVELTDEQYERVIWWVACGETFEA